MIEDGAPLLEDESRYARDARTCGERFGRQALGYADENRATTLLAFAAVASAAGRLLRPTR